MKSLKEILKNLETLPGIELFVIDLFCGAGGLSEGVEEARIMGKKCAKVVCCVNHDKNAILSHDANIPDALHFIEDIRTLELSPHQCHRGTHQTALSRSHDNAPRLAGVHQLLESERRSAKGCRQPYIGRASFQIH